MWDATIEFFDSPEITSIVDEYVKMGLVDCCWKYDEQMMTYTADASLSAAEEINEQLNIIGEDTTITTY